MKTLWKAASIAALSLAVSASVIAAPPPPPPHHPGLLGLFKSKKPFFAGNIIGNKRTHVFHMPGDPGALPAPQNRVYFHTVAQAIAAGYHRAGSHGGPMPHHPMMMSPHHGMMHM